MPEAQIKIRKVRRIVNLSKEEIELFNSRVDKNGLVPDQSNESYRGLANCHLWNGRMFSNGYGEFGRIGNSRDSHGAHRVSWVIANGEIPLGIDVLHKCDNERCVNPAHLFLGTDADNARDKVSKGRQSKGDRHGRRVPFGERQHCAKLTEAKIIEIREIHARGAASKRALARMYKVDRKNINLILNRQAWRHVA